MEIEAAPSDKEKKKHNEAPDEKRHAAAAMLMTMVKDGTLKHGSLTIVANEFDACPAADTQTDAGSPGGLVTESRRMCDSDPTHV